jgi:hypothetical protein
MFQGIARAITGNPRCTYCSKDGVWSRDGQQVCDQHKQEMAAIGAAATKRR